MSFAPRKSNPSGSLSHSNSFKASHQSTPKPLGKSAGKSTSKTQLMRKTPDLNDPLIKRISLLEDVVSNLQLQHDTFLPLLQIVDRVGDVLNLEEQATYFINSASELEVLISKQAMNAKDSFENTDNIIMPSSVTEGTGLSCRSLPEMQNSLADIEASIHSMIAKRKVNLKKQEVQCKEELLKIMQEIDVELQDVKKEVIELQSTLVSTGFKEFDVLDAKDQDLRGRVKTGMKCIEIALEEHALYGGKGGDNWLLEELSYRVDDAVKELNDHLDYKYRQLEINFKQQFASLRSLFNRVKDETSQIESMKNLVMKPSKEILQLGEKCKKSLEILENILKHEFLAIDDISVNLNENLIELNEKARNLVKDLKSVEDEEKIRVFADGKVEFEQMLKGSSAEINTLGELVESCNVSCRAELLRLDESISRIEKLKTSIESSGSKVKIEDFRSKQQAIRGKIEENQKKIGQDFQDLQQRLEGLWKAINHEASLGIELEPKKEDPNIDDPKIEDSKIKDPKIEDQKIEDSS